MKKLLLCISLSLISNLAGFGQASNYNITTPVTGLSYPVAFDFLPDGRYIITLKGGNAAPCTNGKILMYSATGTLIGTFYNLTDSVQCDFERGLLGICVDVDFATNRYIYAYYNHRYNGDERIRIVRFTENNNLGTAPKLIVDIDVANNIAGNHVGGNLHIRPSQPNKLYFTVGELAVQSNAQMKTNPYGKHLRINKDGTIPNDNPFYDDGNPATGNDDRIWCLGNRNPFDFTFSALNDSLYSSENGANTWDEVNQISPGKNYGWATCEGFHTQGSTSTLCNLAGAKKPLATWGSPLPAVTGILHYTSSAIPEIQNHLLVADNDNGNITDLTLGNAPKYDTVLTKKLWFDVTTSGGLTTLKQGKDGCVYAMKGGYTTSGAIYRICPKGVGIYDSKKELINVQGIYPTPLTETATLKYLLKYEAKVRVEISDITGRKIAQVLNTSQVSGEHEIKINTDALGLQQGIYLCRIFINDQPATVEKVMVMK